MKCTAAPDNAGAGEYSNNRAEVGHTLVAALWVLAVAQLWINVPSVRAADPGPTQITTEHWLEQLKHGSFEVRTAAADALGVIGPAAAVAVPDLVRALNDEHVEVHWYALDALGRIGEPASSAVPAIALVLANLRRDRYSRSMAARALGLLGTHNDAAAAALTAQLAATDGNVRVESALALWRVSHDPRATAVLVEVVGAEDDESAFRACMALAQIGRPAKPGTTALLAALSRPNADVRRGAAEALGQIGPSIVPELLAQLDQLEPVASSSAADALGTIARDLRAGVLYCLDASPAELNAAAEALGPATLVALTELVDCEHPSANAAAGRALSNIGLTALPTLAGLLADDCEATRTVAAAALVALESELPANGQVRVRFQRELKSSGPDFDRALARDRLAQRAAARAYALLPLDGTAQSRGLLAKVVKTDDLATRQYAAQALARLQRSPSPH
jgi:HEAT repeat protein